MAEFVLTKLAESIVSQTVRRVSELLIHEAYSLRSVRDDVVLLQDDLESLVSFLKDADNKQEHDQSLRKLVLRVKDIASDAVDAIETFILKDPRHLQKYAEFWNNQICCRRGDEFTAELQRSLRRSSLNDEDDDVIILEDSSRALTAELTKELDRLCIVSVVGMGGLGKTTLAKRVFNSVKQHFDCSAWVFISQQYVPRDVLIEILTQILGKDRNRIEVLEIMKNRRDTLNALKEHELIDLLKEELKEKRYLVVLDDIWSIQAWDSIKGAFPKGKNGSKLLFTTRNREVATSADPLSSPVEPPFLSLEESWELLQRKAFPRDIVGDHGYPAEFNKLGKEMAKKCGGLPLAVVVLGGLLSTKNSLDEWKKVMEDVNSHLSKHKSRQQYEGVHGILALSYHDLPYYLKPCFLYLGNFPEDSEIPKNKLVRLWIAEGFIMKPARGETEQTLEEVAKGYLEELIDRCMVQVERRDHTGIGVKTCRMHDLIREVCTLEAINESFAQIMQHHHELMMPCVGSVASFHQLDCERRSRRLVIHPGGDLESRNTNWASIFSEKHVGNASWVEQVHPNLRSLLCLGGTLSLSALKLKLSNFRMLRVLELNVAGESKIPRCIGNLIHLRYLRLDSSFKTIYLPPSIGNLRNLNTLDLGNCFVAKPVWMISRLIHLRHVLLPYVLEENSKWHHVRIDELKDIETLKKIPSCVLIRYDALNRLTSVRNIDINFEGSNNDEVRRVLGSPIIKSGQLRSLYMHVSSDDGFPSLESLSSCHSLSKLGLHGKIFEIMHSNCNRSLQFLPASLTKLNLWWSQMKQDPMPVLEKLPNLRFLRLGSYTYGGSRMVCSANGFPKLETLVLSLLLFLREWIVEKGAMRSLAKLDLYGIFNLEMIPKGLEFVTSLKELNIARMNNSFCKKIQVKNGIVGEDYYKVRHIPFISVTDIM